METKKQPLQVAFSCSWFWLVLFYYQLLRVDSSVEYI
jgi:hypothetical protein